MHRAFSILVATPAALEAIHESGQSPALFLNRQAVILGTRLLSAHKTRRGRWVWTVTEADRSVTAILLPSEFEPS